MAIVKIQFNVPTSIYRFRWHNLKQYIRWLFNKPKCSSCGTTMLWGVPEFETINHPRMTVHHYIHGKNLCRTCLLKAIESAPSQVGHKHNFDSDIVQKCDKCHRDVESYKAFYLGEEFMDRIGICYNGAWNWSRVCKDCIVECITTGKETCNHFGVYYGKMVPLNKFGLPVVDGKVKFPSR